MCQFGLVTAVPMYSVKHYSGCFCKGVHCLRLTFKQWTLSSKLSALTCVVFSQLKVTLEQDWRISTQQDGIQPTESWNQGFPWVSACQSTWQFSGLFKPLQSTGHSQQNLTLTSWFYFHTETWCIQKKNKNKTLHNMRVLHKMHGIKEIILKLMHSYS